MWYGNTDIEIYLSDKEYYNEKYMKWKISQCERRLKYESRRLLKLKTLKMQEICQEEIDKALFEISKCKIVIDNLFIN